MHSCSFRRKGNALLLVSGLLVMLTLIAAAYLSRSRAQRTTAAAIHDTSVDASRASMISQQLASDVALHLFLRPIDPNSVGAGIFGGNSAAARRNASAFEARYGVEGSSTLVGANGRGDMLADAISPQAPLAWNGTPTNRGDGWPDGFNFAPYSVMPWTNWPDHRTPVDLDTPGANPENNRFYPYLPPLNDTFGIASSSTVASNPIGNPGFGDTRWLRSTEPLRMTQWTLKPTGTPTPVPDGSFFSHWLHLSFPATANNGWRLVPDISDIEGHVLVSGESVTGRYAPGAALIGAGTFVGGAMSGDMTSDRDGLGTPYEQWLGQVRPTPIAIRAGAQPTDNDTAFVSDFSRRRNFWFQRSGYLNAVGSGNAASMLPNLFKLDDPLGIGRAFDPGAVPVPQSDEFVENSPRNLVSRTFADADGDGWTDSFWFLVPIGQEKNVRTVVGVSIIDNAAMVDVNVATRADRHTTTGFTPADLALVTSEPEGAYLGQIGSTSEPSELGSAPWTDTRVGLFDSPRNFARGRFSAGDPKVSSESRPAGTDPSLFDAVGFEQGFDAYRWAGRPTPMIAGDSSAASGWSWTVVESGEPTFLGALGLWFEPGGTTNLTANHWNGYLHTLPRSANRDPIPDIVTAPARVDLLFANARDSLQVGPWNASAPPGTASRWSQSEPLFASFGGADPRSLESWGWGSWLDASFNPASQPPTNAPNPRSAYPGSPFMRPEERTRWFRAGVSGELLAFGPFAFHGANPVSLGWRDATLDLRLPASGVRDFLGTSVPFRPFDVSDEVEMRAYGGPNDPSAMTRLERALNGDNLSRLNSSVPDTLLRSSVISGEAGRAGSQLTSAQWVKDLRRKITTLSGQRNEMMPPHLWTGRNFLALSRFIDNPYESFQNANLWLDLHPQIPGPVDEDGDGALSSTELQWGAYDLMRVTTSDDPFPDGIKIVAGNSPVVSPSDWSRGVRLFEYMNRKFDLRQPLLIQRRLSQSDLEQIPGPSSSPKPYTNEFGLVDEQGFPKLAYAYSVQEQRRAMIDFALNARQRLRPALRTVSPQRQRTSEANPFLATLRDLGPRQASTTVDGTVNVSYASYTDRFVDQLRMGLDARVASAVEPADRQRMLRTDMKALADLGDLAWRSAWSTEALTASLAANMATWRSRPDLIRETETDPTRRKIDTTNDSTLRPVWQPILPWQESVAAQRVADGNPYVDGVGTYVAKGVEFSVVKHRPDYGDTPVPTDVTRRMREFASPQAIRAVDPARPSKVANADWGKGLPNADHPASTEAPTEDSADLVFPGNEKQPFLSECFFGWVYPATTVTRDGKVELPSAPGRLLEALQKFPQGGNPPGGNPLIDPAAPPLHPADTAALTDGSLLLSADAQQHLQATKFVAVVNGQVGRPRLEPDPSDPRNNPILNFSVGTGSPTDRVEDPRMSSRSLIPTALAMNYARGLFRHVSFPAQPSKNKPPPRREGQPAPSYIPLETVGEPDRDGFRDELNEIRTPVLVVQVANPWNEPIRLADFRLNLFGHIYDFPDFELGPDGELIKDASGEPVPLMLPAATEFQPATATVYLIPDSVGAPEVVGSQLILDDVDRIRFEQANQNDLSTTAIWDPLFRRRWLDYFDLYEYSDGAHLSGPGGGARSRDASSTRRVDATMVSADAWPCSSAARASVWDRSTSPITSSLFSQPTWIDDDAPPGQRKNLIQRQGDDLRARLSRSKLLNAMDLSDVLACEGPTPIRRRDKSRINDLWRFKYSLTPDALRTGITLERILRDPSGRNPAWGQSTVAGDSWNAKDRDGLFQTTAVAPAESTIDKYRLAFWPLRSWSNLTFGGPSQAGITEIPNADLIGFPRDSREPSSVFPPRRSDGNQRGSPLESNKFPRIEPTTLVVDRFDADSDFDHWTTVINGPVDADTGRTDLPLETSRTAEVSLAHPGLAPASPHQVPLPLDAYDASTDQQSRPRGGGVPPGSAPSGEMPAAIGVSGTPIARPDDLRPRFFESDLLNQDRNLVTGGRFWTAAAQITLPPTRHRWPDGRDRRMMGLEDAWFAASGGVFDSRRYFGDPTRKKAMLWGPNGGIKQVPNPKGDLFNPRRDAYWLQWRHQPSLPVLLGSTMMVNAPSYPVMVWDLLSRLPSRIVAASPFSADADPIPIRDQTGKLSFEKLSYRQEYFMGSEWRTEHQLFPICKRTAPGSSDYQLLSPTDPWLDDSTRDFRTYDNNVPHGELDATELAKLCRDYPALDRDSNLVPDALQKVFMGFDEPEGSAAYFPPPTALSIISSRSTLGDGSLGVRGSGTTGGFQFYATQGSADAGVGNGDTECPLLPPVRGLDYQAKNQVARDSEEYQNKPGSSDRRPPFSCSVIYEGGQPVGRTSATAADPSLLIPGIILRTGNESRDYFTTWTRVARSWARNFDASFATRKADSPSLPNPNGEIEQGRVQANWDPRLRPNNALARQKDLATGFGMLSGRVATYPALGNRLSIQELAARNLPLWTWERQVVSASSGGSGARDESFSPGKVGVPEGETPFMLSSRDQDGNVMASPNNLTARYGAAGPDSLAPRYVFAQRSEPDRCDRPVDMRQNGTTGELVPALWRGDFRPIRQELTGYQCSRYGRSYFDDVTESASTKQVVRVGAEHVARAGVLIYRAPRWSPLNNVLSPYFAYFPDPSAHGSTEVKPPTPADFSQRIVEWTAANNGEFLTAAGDLFAMEPPATRLFDEPWDPDVWAPAPVTGNPTYEDVSASLLWMHRVRTFNWLTRPVVAPLPDMQGLGWAADGSDPVSTLGPSDTLPIDAYPELIMRKPTAFNCQTVVDDRLSRNLPGFPYSGTVRDLVNAGGYRRFLFAKYGEFLVDSNDQFVDRPDDGSTNLATRHWRQTTRFVYPPWARPAPRPMERAMSGSRQPEPLSTPLTDIPSRSAYRARWIEQGGAGGLKIPTGVDLFPFSDGGQSRLSLYRVLMGDKGGRLLDHHGKMLAIDRAFMRPARHGGDILAADADPITRMQMNMGLDVNGNAVGGPMRWLMQGVWNTLDRFPHGGSLQMLQKDDDFEQLGEIADVFLWGPAYRVYSNPETSYLVRTGTGSKEYGTKSGTDWSSWNVTLPANSNAVGPFVNFKREVQNNSRGGWLRPTDLQTTVNYFEQAALNGVDVRRGVNADGASLLIPPRLVSQCRATFAEIMTGRVPGFPVGEGVMVNRLQVDPPNVAFHQPPSGAPDDPAWGTPIQMGGTSGLRTPYAPNVPWGMRVFDAFTLDGAGGVLRYDWRDQFAGRSVDMNASSAPVPGALTLPAAGFATDVLPFENSARDPGNPLFNPSQQDGLPSVSVGFSTTRFTAARPAGALIPPDVYRDETVRSTAAGSLARVRVHPTDGTPIGVVTRATMAQWEHDRSPSLSGGFRGRPVPGVLNVNTAPVEAFRSLPHMNQMVYDDSGRSRFAGSLNFGLSSYASEAAFAFGTTETSVGGLAGTLPAVAGRSVLNTDTKYTNLSTNGDRGANPAVKVAEALAIYRDRQNPNVLLANKSTTATDWFVRDTRNPMIPTRAGTRLSPVNGTSTSVPDSFPVYPTYVDRGEGAGPVDLDTSSAVVGTGGNVTGPRRDPFWFVYFNRGMSAVPGVHSIGELVGLSRTTRTRVDASGAPLSLPTSPGFSDFPDWQYDQSWSVRLAGQDPYRSKRDEPSSGQGWQSYFLDPDRQLGSDPLDARLSTDRQGVRTFDLSVADEFVNNTGLPGSDSFPDQFAVDAFRVEPDGIAGDSEERNMLFKGISNMISTRSDVFTAYFRVKTVKQGADGRWNAMDPETLLSEARYVMCIDRTNVNRPTDKPRIVYFTQVRD